MLLLALAEIFTLCVCVCCVCVLYYEHDDIVVRIEMHSVR